MKPNTPGPIVHYHDFEDDFSHQDDTFTFYTLPENPAHFSTTTGIIQNAAGRLFDDVQSTTNAAEIPIPFSLQKENLNKNQSKFISAQKKTNWTLFKCSLLFLLTALVVLLGLLVASDLQGSETGVDSTAASLNPTRSPSSQPTKFPTKVPTPFPTPNPTTFPTPNPTAFPTPNPTTFPTPNPTVFPTPNPTVFPTPFPTPNPTAFPTPLPTPRPTPFPTPFPIPTDVPPCDGCQIPRISSVEKKEKE
eukprot:snap_masked-scaffold_30-processed-gene-2.0-mRNA-1 protein AED:0.32 eAED:0.32 QI:0/-1/0/1/-1/1/1/0/247